MTTTINTADQYGRPAVEVCDNDHTPHWKFPYEGKGWFSAKFKKERRGRLSIDITEFSESNKGRISNKRVMIELTAEAVAALAEVLAKDFGEGQHDNR